MNKVHFADCMEIMKGMRDNSVELAIVDPPYRDINQPDQWLRANSGDMKKWEPAPRKEYFDELMRISENQIIWGGNYFTNFLEPNNNWIIWHKMNDGVHFSMCEMAWSSIRKNIKLWKHNHAGTKKIHPTQKPVALYKYILQNYAKPNDKIFDSHVGSGSIRIACHDMGFDFEGCEIDEEYWRGQEERFNTHILQNNLFPPKELQKSILQGVLSERQTEHR